MLVDVGRGAQVDSLDVVYLLDGFEETDAPHYPLYDWDTAKARCGILLRQGAVVPVFITIDTLRMRMQRAKQEDARRAAWRVVQMGGPEIAPPPLVVKAPRPKPAAKKAAAKAPAAPTAAPPQ